MKVKDLSHEQVNLLVAKMLEMPAEMVNWKCLVLLDIIPVGKHEGRDEWLRWNSYHFTPSTSVCRGMPILFHHKVSLFHLAESWGGSKGGKIYYHKEPLMAGLMALIADVYGDEVDGIFN